MAESEKKDDIRVEDRRHFDKEGNIIREEKAQEEASKKQLPPDSHRPSESDAPPKIDFMSILFSYIHTALIYLGDMKDPIQKKTAENLDGAREMIDILDLLQQKTKGNLNAEESQYLESALFDLRMRYMQKSKLIK